METNQPHTMFSMLSDKKSYSLEDMKWLASVRQAECPITLWFLAKSWTVSYDTVDKVYIVTPYIEDVGNLPIAIIKTKKGFRIDLSNSAIDLLDCSREETDSTSKQNDY